MNALKKIITEIEEIVEGGEDYEAPPVAWKELVQWCDTLKTCISNIGDLSDGYHTFNELYDHRAVLFSVICHCFPERAWKSRLHEDGTMFDGMFVVGFDTDLGQATYHYYVDLHWETFKVKELERMPKYDGHTSNQALMRLFMFGRENKA